MNEIQAIAYENGTIRNADGVLIAFYDADARLVHINRIVTPFRAADMTEAMELVGQHAKA